MHRCVTHATRYTRETRSQNVSPDAICISSKTHIFCHLRETRPALMPSICENSITGQRFSKRLWSLLNSSSSYTCIELARSGAICSPVFMLRQSGTTRYQYHRHCDVESAVLAHEMPVSRHLLPKGWWCHKSVQMQPGSQRIGRWARGVVKIECKDRAGLLEPQFLVGI
jgi:hypothetical protein